MITRAELEAEIAELKAQNERLREIIVMLQEALRFYLRENGDANQAP